MGENSTTLGDQVGSPRVVPILRPVSDFSFCPSDFTTVYEHGRTFTFLWLYATPKSGYEAQTTL